MKTLLAFVLLSASVLAQDQKQHAFVLPGKMAAVWNFHDETRQWLSIESANHRDWPEEGFHPSHTYILVKDYKPVLKQIGKDKWQITFVSPVTELGDGIP